MQLRRTVLTLCWLTLAGYALWVVLVRTSPSQLIPRGTHVRLGSAPLAEGGGRISLLPRDSAVAVLVTTAECAAGRAATPALRRLAAELERAGVAFRVVVKSRPVAARQYSRLYPRPDFVLRDQAGKALGPLNTTVVPSLFVVDRNGMLVGRYAPLRLAEQEVEPFAARIARATRTADERAKPT